MSPEIQTIIQELRSRAKAYRTFALAAQVLLVVAIFGGIYFFGYAGQFIAEAKQSQYLGVTSTLDTIRRQKQVTERELADNKLTLDAYIKRRADMLANQRQATPTPGQNLPDVNAEYEKKLLTDKVDGKTETLRNLTDAESRAAEKIKEVLAPANEQLALTLTTKIGSVLLLLFFAKILVSIFRYYIRLASFYQSRADVFSILHLNLSLEPAELTILLSTETLDFEKGNETNPDSLIALLKQLQTFQEKLTSSKSA